MPRQRRLTIGDAAQERLQAQRDAVNTLVTVGIVRADIAQMSPLQVMLHAMHIEADRDRWGAAAAIAAVAAPYVHPRLSATTVRVADDLGDKTDDEIAAEIRSMEARIRYHVDSVPVSPVDDVYGAGGVGEDPPDLDGEVVGPDR